MFRWCLVLESFIWWSSNLSMHPDWGTDFQAHISYYTWGQFKKLFTTGVLLTVFSSLHTIKHWLIDRSIDQLIDVSNTYCCTGWQCAGHSSIAFCSHEYIWPGCQTWTVCNFDLYKLYLLLYRVTMCRAFINCRLYSWIRLTWMSNMDCVLILMLYVFCINDASFILFSCKKSNRTNEKKSSKGHPCNSGHLFYCSLT